MFTSRILRCAQANERKRDIIILNILRNWMPSRNYNIHLFIVNFNPKHLLNICMTYDKYELNFILLLNCCSLKVRVSICISIPFCLLALWLVFQPNKWKQCSIYLHYTINVMLSFSIHSFIGSNLQSVWLTNEEQTNEPNENSTTFKLCHLYAWFDSSMMMQAHSTRISYAFQIVSMKKCILHLTEMESSTYLYNYVEIRCCCCIPTDNDDLWYKSSRSSIIDTITNEKYMVHCK